MAKIDPEIKAKLKSSGVWKAFCDYRDELKASGDTAPEAHEKSLSRFLTPGVPAESRPTSAANPTAGAPPSRPDAIDVMAAYAEDFRGKEVSEVESIRWVARNINIVDATPVDCPDPMAWNLLVQCRGSQMFCQDFWKTMFTKIIPSRAQLETKVDEENDGDSTIALIGKFQEAARKAEEACLQS